MLALVAEGLTSLEIARRTGRSVSTVESLVRNARQRVGARTRREAVMAADLGESPGPGRGSSNPLQWEASELLRLLGGGRTLHEAARALAISDRTAWRRLARARSDLGVLTTTEAVVRSKSLAG